MYYILASVFNQGFNRRVLSKAVCRSDIRYPNHIAVIKPVGWHLCCLRYHWGALEELLKVLGVADDSICFGVLQSSP